MAQVDPRLKSRPLIMQDGWRQFLNYCCARSFICTGFLHNYGFAIIVRTILIKFILLPFSLKGTSSMKKTGDVQRKLQYIQQKYKDDPETLARERAEIMRKHGIGQDLSAVRQSRFKFRFLLRSTECYQVQLSSIGHRL